MVDFSQGFECFYGRDDALARIKRYNMARRSPMYYRTNNLLHSRRVHLLVNDIKEVLRERYGRFINVDKTSTLSLVHDDAEIITGDIQLYHKERMTEAEKKKIEKDEADAIEVLAKRWPQEIRGFNYRALLLHALHKDCLEAQVVSFCDKVDAFCEALHEVFAGNAKFKGPAENYVKRIGEFPEKFPALTRMIGYPHPLLGLPFGLNVGEILKNRRAHTEDNLFEMTDLPQYNRWKQITIEQLGFEPLVGVRERELLK